jgi:hypothetical protein
MPSREEGDSPEMHVNKRGRTDEVPLLTLTQRNESHNSDPVVNLHANVPIPEEPFPRGQLIVLNAPVLDSTRSNVPVLDSLALTVLNVPVLNSPALNLPEESRRAPKSKEELWQRAHAGKAERIAKSTASSDGPRRSAPAPNAFAPAPSPSDNMGPIADLRGYNRYVLPPDKTRPGYREGYILHRRGIADPILRGMETGTETYISTGLKSSRQRCQTSRESAKRGMRRCCMRAFWQSTHISGTKACRGNITSLKK